MTMCESCLNYELDEYSGEYFCAADLDEDETVHLMRGEYKNCPYYHSNDEYELVRKQN